MSLVCEADKESPYKTEVAVPEEDASIKVGSESERESFSACEVESAVTEIALPVCEMITPSVIEEEGKLTEEAEAQEEKKIKERKELWLHMEEESKEERYRRLQCLLMKSNMYTEYLLRRMERQKEEEIKRRERIIKKAAKEAQKEKEMKEAPENIDSLVAALKPVRKTKGKFTLRAPISKTSLSASSSPAVVKSTLSTPGREGGKMALIEPAKCEPDVIDSPTTSFTEGKTGSPSSDKENSAIGKITAKQQDAEDFELTLREYLGEDLIPADAVYEGPEGSSGDLIYTESKKGRKRKQLDYNEQSPQGAKLLTHFFKPVVKRRRQDEEEVGKEKSDKKAIKEHALFKDEPDIEGDGTIVRPALFTGGELRRYQVEGLNWLKVLFENGVNGILADEMGLGKTIQCVALICQIISMGAHGPFLVVAPLSTLPNWRMEFKRFAPNLPVVFYHGSKDERAGVVRQIRKKHEIMENIQVQPVVITSYEIAMIDRPVLKIFDWTYMIVDEGHRIKNKNCRLIRELKAYRNAHRLLLTGTPLQNNLSELWSLLNFLLPEIFDDLGSFETWFDVEAISDESADEAIIEEERKKNILGMLHQILTPFMLRRVKTDVDIQIPPKKELLVYAPLSQLQHDLYESTVDKTILKKLRPVEDIVPVELDSKGRPKRGKKSVNRKPEPALTSSSEVNISLNNIMMQLRKICNHPYLIEYPLDAFDNYKIDEDLVKKCGKMMFLDKMLPELRKRGHKVLIFSQMTKMLDILEDYMFIRKIEYCRLDGSCKVDDRQESMNKFNSDPDTWIFLLSTRAGGLGVNLIGADTVIIYDSDWNPQADLQAQDRCHRIGQTKPVVVYRFVTANTIDQKIVERAAAKRKLEKMIIHKGKFKSGLKKDFTSEVTPLCAEELMELLKSQDHCGVIEQGKHGQVISDEDLDALLDRRDLLEEFHKSQQSAGEEKK